MSTSTTVTIPFRTLGEELGLSNLLLKSLSRLNYTYALPIQSSSLPLILDAGRDCVLHSRTGSGKTVAYMLPILEKIIRWKKNNQGKEGTKALILLPTTDLVDQTSSVLTQLTYYTSTLITSCALDKSNPSRTRSLLLDSPTILLGTPGSVVHFKDKIDLSSCDTVVVDESDLMLSHGYGQDIKAITQSMMPRIYQGVMVSATMGKDNGKLKKWMLNKPAIVRVKDEHGKGELKQFFLTVPEDDKGLVMYVFLKLGVVKQPCIVFANATDTCYRIKLLLEQFSVRCGVVNEQMPSNVRRKVVEKFNQDGGVLVVTDLEDGEGVGSDDDEEDGVGEDEEGEEDTEKGGKKKKSKTSSSDDDDDSSSSSDDDKTPAVKLTSTTSSTSFALGRGVDFRSVKFVINYDLPPSASSYTHRCGRTARGGKSGVALTFVRSGNSSDAQILGKIQSTQPPLPLPRAADDLTSNMGFAPQPAPLSFDLNEIEGFRYRVDDVKRAVTKVRVAECMKKELKDAMLNSDRLREHFEENPADLQILQHDKNRSEGRVQGHLKHIPNYLLPKGMQSYGEEDGKGEGKMAKISEENRVFLDTTDEVGKSTSGRNKWKMKRGKGKWSKRYDPMKDKGKK